MFSCFARGGESTYPQQTQAKILSLLIEVLIKQFVKMIIEYHHDYRTFEGGKDRCFCHINTKLIQREDTILSALQKSTSPVPIIESEQSHSADISFNNRQGIIL